MVNSQWVIVSEASMGVKINYRKKRTNKKKGNLTIIARFPFLNTTGFTLIEEIPDAELDRIGGNSAHIIPEGLCYRIIPVNGKSEYRLRGTSGS